jgi:hypothetical protein
MARFEPRKSTLIPRHNRRGRGAPSTFVAATQRATSHRHQLAKSPPQGASSLSVSRFSGGGSGRAREERLSGFRVSENLLVRRVAPRIRASARRRARHGDQSRRRCPWARLPTLGRCRAGQRQVVGVAASGGAGRLTKQMAADFAHVIAPSRRRSASRSEGHGRTASEGVQILGRPKTSTRRAVNRGGLHWQCDTVAQSKFDVGLRSVRASDLEHVVGNIHAAADVDDAPEVDTVADPTPTKVGPI